MRPSGGGIRAVLSSVGLFSIDRCPCGLPERFGFENAYFATNRGLRLAGAVGDDRAGGPAGPAAAGDPDLPAPLEPPLRLSRGPQAPGESDLAERRELRLQRRALRC